MTKPHIVFETQGNKYEVFIEKDIPVGSTWVDDAKVFARVKSQYGEIRIDIEQALPLIGVPSGGGGTGNVQLSEEQKEKLTKILSEEVSTKSSSTEKKIKVRYFAGKGEKAPTKLDQIANNSGIFANITNYQYTGKKVTAVGFITGQEGEVEIRVCDNAVPLNFEVGARITLKPGTEMQWYPVDIDVPKGKWLGVKCETGAFKYSRGTTTAIGGNGFISLNNGVPNPVVTGGSSASLGFGIEVEETIDTSKPYAGKLFSVLGDSISTYENYITPGNALFYNAERQRTFGLESVNDTWWMKTINELGGLLNTNDAWSGSRVSGNVSPGLAFLRTNRIDANTDVVMVMIGINDLTNNVPLGSTVNPIGHAHVITEITGAYQSFIEKMQGFYPNLEIVLITNLNRWTSGNETTNTNGLTPRLLQDRIKEIAKLYGLKCVDLNEIGHNKFSNTALTPDNTHPNKLGMERIAKKIISELN